MRLAAADQAIETACVEVDSAPWQLCCPGVPGAHNSDTLRHVALPVQAIVLMVVPAAVDAIKRSQQSPVGCACQAPPVTRRWLQRQQQD